MPAGGTAAAEEGTTAAASAAGCLLDVCAAAEGPAGASRCRYSESLGMTCNQLVFK